MALCYCRDTPAMFVPVLFLQHYTLTSAVPRRVAAGGAGSTGFLIGCRRRTWVNSWLAVHRFCLLRELGLHVLTTQVLTTVPHIYNMWPKNFNERPHRRGNPKIASSPEGIWGPHEICFLGSTRVHIPTGISIGSAILSGSILCPTNRQTHRHT